MTANPNLNSNSKAVLRFLPNFQYRPYYAVEGQTYTDGILHQLELPDDGT